MKELQYFILAKEIIKNQSGIFSYIDVSQHLYIDKLPAKGKFDFAIICGPGWKAGKYHLHIAMKFGDQEIQKIGFTDIVINDNFHIFTALIKNINIAVEKEQPFYFLIYKHEGEYLENEDTRNLITGDLIIERPFNVVRVEATANI